jgi:hypothetical protein
MIVAGNDLVGVKIKVESLIKQSLFGKRDLFALQKLLEYTAVFPQHVVYIPYIIVAVAVELVIV